MNVTSLDHLVLTVSNIDATVAFYCDVLGMEVEQFTVGDGTVRVALKFGVQKINLHQAGGEFKPNARRAVPGSADLCFLSQTAIAQWQVHLAAHAVVIEEGPVRRTGAQGPILSIYVRDPDENLIEVSCAIAF